MKRFFIELKLGEKFQRAINSIYRNQYAAMIINRDTTKRFEAQKGTRQGCPLSPLLFVLVLEVLLKDIQTDNTIPSIKVKNHTFKYHAFVDDMGFFFFG